MYTLYTPVYNVYIAYIYKYSAVMYTLITVTHLITSRNFARCSTSDCNGIGHRYGFIHLKCQQVDDSFTFDKEDPTCHYVRSTFNL